MSLFDFEGFDPDVYGEKYPMSSWLNFVPYQRAWGCAVWIEIDRDKVGSHMISPADLKTRQDAEGAHVHKRMPQIEAAHLGPLPRAAFKRAFLVREGDSDLHLPARTGASNRLPHSDGTSVAANPILSAFLTSTDVNHSPCAFAKHTGNSLWS